jgi:uncharacterized membrane protein YsdA (DUF1294 family)
VIKLLLAWLLLVNALSFLVFWWDKRRAQAGGRRIRERELLLWVLAGGAPGAWIAMRTFRHKTRKLSFRAAFWGVVLLQLTALLWLL